MVIKGSLWRNCKFWAQNIQNRSEYASMGTYWKYIRQNSLHAWNLDIENYVGTCSHSLGHSLATSYITSHMYSIQLFWILFPLRPLNRGKVWKDVSAFDNVAVQILVQRLGPHYKVRSSRGLGTILQLALFSSFLCDKKTYNYCHYDFYPIQRKVLLCFAFAFWNTFQILDDSLGGEDDTVCITYVLKLSTWSPSLGNQNS